MSTDKVDTEIPSPVSGILRGITVAEDETVAVGAELAVIDEEGSAGGTAPAAGSLRLVRLSSGRVVIAWPGKVVPIQRQIAGNTTITRGESG